jgi:hypothetical protein
MPKIVSRFRLAGLFGMIASLFGLAGLLGIIVARFLGTSAAANYLLLGSTACLVFAGLLVLVHFTISYWIELNRTV